MPKTPPKRKGMGLMFPFRDDDSKYFQFINKNLNKSFITNKYFRNRYIHVFAKIIYGAVKGTKGQKFAQLTRLLTDIHGQKSTHADTKIRIRVRTLSKIITLVGEGYYKWNEIDGNFYSTDKFKKRLSSNQNSLTATFNHYVGKLNAKEQMLLGHILAPSRKVENKKVYSRPTRAGEKTRTAWNKGMTPRKRLQRKHGTYKSHNI
jgi:hypothetical protein